MLDEVKPDVVSIGPRWLDQHRDMVVAAAERGIHIYLEKPLCRTLAEADEMVAACERTHAKLAIAHTTRYSPRMPVVQEMIAAGKIGRVLELRGRGKEDARGGGEDLWVLGTHIMDLIRLFGGDPSWCFGRGHASGPRRSPRPTWPTGTRASARWPATRSMPCTACRAARRPILPRTAAHRASGPASRLQIFGSEGILEITTGYLPSVKYLADPSWSPGQSGAKWESVSSAGLGKPEPLTEDKAHGGNRPGGARVARGDSRKPAAQTAAFTTPGRPSR